MYDIKSIKKWFKISSREVQNKEKYVAQGKGTSLPPDPKKYHLYALLFDSFTLLKSITCFLFNDLYLQSWVCIIPNL